MNSIAINESRHISRPYLILILGALTAFGPMSIDMYLPAFGQIGTEFDAPISLVKLTLGVYIFGISCGQLIYGPLSDKIGRKNLLIFGMALFALSAVGCALAPNIEALIFFRLLQALGGCTGMVITRAIVRDLFETHESAKIFSTLILIMGVAPILAPTLGGLIITHLNWRYIFWILVVAGVAAVLVMVRWLPESHPEEKRNPEALRKSFSTYFFLLKDRSFMMFSLTAGMIQASMFCYISSAAYVFMKVFGLSELQFGRLFGLIAFGFILSSQLNNLLLKRYNYFQIFRTALIVDFLLTFVFVFVGRDVSLGPYIFLIPLFLCISSVGFIFPNATAGALAGHAKIAGSTSALMGMITFGCSALAILVVSFFDDVLPTIVMSSSFCVCVGLALLIFSLLGEKKEMSN